MPRTAVLDCNILKNIYRTHDIKSVLIVGATYRINLLEYCSASNRGFDQDARRKITVYMFVRLAAGANMAVGVHVHTTDMKQVLI